MGGQHVQLSETNSPDVALGCLKYVHCKNGWDVTITNYTQEASSL